MHAETQLRRIVPGDWPALRALRLEMVQDTPLAFSERYDDLVHLPDDAWRARAVRGSDGGDSCQLVAVADGRLVGQAITFPGEDGLWWLIGVYLQPAVRGHGLLARLVDGLVAHAADGGGTRLRLHVHEDNPRARAAYRRLGFVETGERSPYALGEGDELAMDRPLARACPW